MLRHSLVDHLRDHLRRQLLCQKLHMLKHTQGQKLGGKGLKIVTLHICNGCLSPKKIRSCIDDCTFFLLLFWLSQLSEREALPLSHLWAAPIYLLHFSESIVDCHLHRQWSLPNTKLEGNQNRYSLTFLHIHWPSWGCWLKVSGAEILMSIAPSSCLLLTANWQHGIKLKRGGQLFSLLDWLIDWRYF